MGVGCAQDKHTKGARCESRGVYCLFGWPCGACSVGGAVVQLQQLQLQVVAPMSSSSGGGSQSACVKVRASSASQPLQQDGFGSKAVCLAAAD
jgi:hypothetical protein